MRTASLQLSGVPTVDTPSQSLQDLRPGFDSLSVEPEGLPTNSNLALAAFTWENDIFRPEWSHLSDLTTGSAEGIPVGPYFEASSISGALQYSSNINTPPGQSIRPSSPTPISLAYRDPSSLFERRKFSEPEVELTADLALHILRSYPYMMVNRDSVPPFIHPKYQCLSEDDEANPSPLDAALNLSKTMLHGRRMNKSLIWGLIRIEQERLLNEYHRFNKWEVLEALQSLVIYILLRIIEGRQDYTNFDTQLLASLNAICQQFTTKFGTLISSDEHTGRMMMWKDWVFFESRRRILHAQITTPSSAMPEYSSSPAPSPMKLWHAKNEFDWAVDYAEYLHENTMHGMLRNGDLTELKETGGKQHDRWYAYADSFGLLVTLAAKMIS
ncbi:hypothetical protein VPNG_04586 [Cytospora leucostoma]|uniref:Uncharacterized protein n=1 Tax=Cytospora leucostoma TaxID=1230097 RepID=A0A423XCA5_9PEZI|nr:hypothetical protein VPNG_04586 [Cytospora leucostoma]